MATGAKSIPLLRKWLIVLSGTRSCVDIVQILVYKSICKMRIAAFDSKCGAAGPEDLEHGVGGDQAHVREVTAIMASIAGEQRQACDLGMGAYVKVGQRASLSLNLLIFVTP